MDLCWQNNVFHFNMLSRLIIAFLPRSKHFLIPRLLSPSAVILEHKKTKSVTVSTVSPSICHKVMGLDVMHLSFLNIEFQATFLTGKNTGMCCHFLLWRSSWPRDCTCISCIASIFFTAEPSEKPNKYTHTHIYVCINIHIYILFHCDLL